MAKRKRSGLQNRYARVRFPLRPQNSSSFFNTAQLKKLGFPCLKGVKYLTMIEMAPHHALIFTKSLYNKGPTRLAEYLANDQLHKSALERNLADVMNHHQDEPITLATGQNDLFCKGCPGKDGPYLLAGMIQHNKCNLTTPEAKQYEQKYIERIRKLTGKENPTIREIYQASCEEWKALEGKHKNEDTT
jgi:hypothetical protein